MMGERAEEAVRVLIEAISGDDPGREGLRDTPRRVVSALSEMTRGYEDDPGVILDQSFGETCHEFVVVRDIDFVSLCEHHLLPFTGVAHVGYLPGDGHVVGLSKFARLVDCYARRLQVQERMTEQIAEAIMKHTDAQAAGVVVEATHSCMSCRGVRKAHARMVTSSLQGSLLRDAAQRAEFMALVRG
jgi:GTP cyclohydrolase IA